MGIVDRVNAAIVRRINPATGRDDAAALIATIKQIETLVALRREQLVGDTLLLVASLHNGRVLQVDEESPGWADLLAALDHSGRTTVSSALWRLHLAEADADTPLTLIHPA